ncbi:UPF0184 protein AAEL002161 [Manduca sexta]|uniref:Bublin coiled-coil protein n=1 Tax=Manduca sexta TaxID=7130 RepID=A0A922CHC7_MANSE|nr:UPF0184 protein AAEL002161 [Manduca sexta]KAG6446227.1 hypothetical protein O3G_MSEX004392 [Manduca sexta]
MAGQERKNCNGDDNASADEIEPTEEQNEENICEEYEMLDSTLDELNSALDYLERKNDDIHEKLKELLQSNIDIRQEMRNENNMDTSANN